MDFDDDGCDEMVVASDDCALRVLKGEDAVHESQEKAPISLLTKINE